MYTKEELDFINKYPEVIKEIFKEFKNTKDKWIENFSNKNQKIKEEDLENYFNSELNDFLKKENKYKQKNICEKDIIDTPFPDIFDLYCDEIDSGIPDLEDLGYEK